MDRLAITFDFHNTLATCPEWFELEVRTLPSAFLGWWGARDVGTPVAERLDDADARYRDLRRDIMAHGNEQDAASCLETVFEAMGITVPDAAVRDGIEHLMREALRGAAPVPGAVETVRQIHEAGIAIGIVSSAVYHPFLEWTLEEFGIADAVEVIVTSASAGFYKSRPEIFLHAAHALGAAPARTVHVGDSLRFDVGGAARAGMGTVWYQHDGGRHDGDAAVPDLTLGSLEAAAPEILRVLHARTAAAAG